MDDKRKNTEHSGNMSNSFLPPDRPRPARLAEIKHCIDQALQVLLRRLEIVPPVDSRGHSECPIAEDLYAQKEEAEADLRRGLAELTVLQHEVEQELVRVLRNLERVNVDAEKLRTRPVIEHYDRAAGELVKEGESLQRELDDIRMITELALAALRRSGLLKFPGRVPQRSPFGGGLPPLPGGPPVVRTHGPMVGGMIQLGPMGAGGLSSGRKP